MQRNEGGKYVPLPFWNPTIPIPNELYHEGRKTSDVNLPLPPQFTKGGGRDILRENYPYKSLAEFLTYKKLSEALYSHHGSVHSDIEGIFEGVRSPEDPVFWVFHALLDSVWEEWQKMKPNT